MSNTQKEKFIILNYKNESYKSIFNIFSYAICNSPLIICVDSKDGVYKYKLSSNIDSFESVHYHKLLYALQVRENSLNDFNRKKFEYLKVIAELTPADVLSTPKKYVRKSLPHTKQPSILPGPAKPEFDVTQYPPYTFFKPTWKSAVAKKFGTFSKK